MSKRERRNTKKSLFCYLNHKKAKINSLYEQETTKDRRPTSSNQSNNNDIDNKIKIIYNSYTKCRGTPQLLQIFCSKCNNYIMTYQKDGPGELLRCYFDRIHLPKELNKRQFEHFKKSEAPKLECSTCDSVIGVPMIYEKEKRPAYRMNKGKSFLKKIGLNLR